VEAIGGSVALPADRDTSPGSVDLRSRPAATCAARDVIAEREQRSPRSRLRSHPQGRETHPNRDRHRLLTPLTAGGEDLAAIVPRFGEEAMRDLVRDEALRTALVREMPSLPLAYLEQRIPSPAGWDRRPCAYLLLSDAYREAAAEARERGWRIEEITGAQHLHIAVAPKPSPTRSSG
jgi:hypothetical protein